MRRRLAILNIQQIEALREANPQLYEALKRLSGQNRRRDADATTLWRLP
jgi:hypothetical protein